MCAVCPLARHGSTQPAASGPGWRSPSAPAAAAQYGGGPVVLEPATSLNTTATTMEHGSARPGFVGVHIGAGQHSEVSNDVNENLAIILMLILPKLPNILPAALSSGSCSAQPSLVATIAMKTNEGISESDTLCQTC